MSSGPAKEVEMNGSHKLELGPRGNKSFGTEEEHSSVHGEARIRMSSREFVELWNRINRKERKGNGWNAERAKKSGTSALTKCLTCPNISRSRDFAWKSC